MINSNFSTFFPGELRSFFCPLAASAAGGPHCPRPGPVPHGAAAVERPVESRRGERGAASLSPRTGGRGLGGGDGWDGWGGWGGWGWGMGRVGGGLGCTEKKYQGFEVVFWGGDGGSCDEALDVEGWDGGYGVALSIVLNVGIVD